MNLNVELTVRHGIITAGSIFSKSPEAVTTTVDDLEALRGQKLHKVPSWQAVLDSSLGTLSNHEKTSVLTWLQHMLPPT